MIEQTMEDPQYKILLIIRHKSVCDCLKTSMKVKNLSVILVLGVLRIVELVNGMCLIRSTSQPKTYGFQCLMSNNYLADVRKAPIDIKRLLFTSSKIEVVRDESFVRLGENLMTLSVLNSGVKEIKDNALRGLAKLEVLDFSKNKLEIVKTAWFKGLASLSVVTFKSNQVKDIEDGFFTTVPAYMGFLDLSENQLTCLPASALVGGFRVHSLHIKHNRLTWSCQTLLMNWFENTKFEIEFQNRPHHLDTLGQPYDLARICAAKLPSKLEPDEEFLNNCAEETTDEFLPLKGNYTVKQVCESPKDKPSPLLDCSE